MEGTAAQRPTALSFVREDVAICDLSDRAETIRQRIDASPYGFALVLADRVVLGRVRRSRLDHASNDASAELLMEPGPSTARPHKDPGELASSLERSGASTAILTTPGGELLGVVSLGDLPDQGAGIASGRRVPIERRVGDGSKAGQDETKQADDPNGVSP
jgi:hypothetical protein